VPRLVFALIAALAACGGAAGGDGGLQPIADQEAMAAEYRAFLDAGRTPADIVAWTAEQSDWLVVDLSDVDQRRVHPGDRLVFIDRGRTALFVVVGKQPLARHGARMVCGHIDTPSPKLRATVVVDEMGEARIIGDSYGGMRKHHWVGTPLGLVGRVAARGGREIPIRVGFGDEFSLFGIAERDGSIVAVAASTARGKKETAKITFLRYLNEQYDITADDLAASELYLVPVWPAREVGLDRSLIGAHGQDDRLNSYAAWRAVMDAGDTEHTAIAWLVDREEIGSTGPTGARSRFLEMVYAWLLRAEGAKADERTLARAFAATSALSSDTPAALNPNFPEPHLKRLAPLIGNGPVMFPYAGRGGKQGSHTARAEIIRETLDVFEAAGAPVQTGELGKVEAGGGGTISKYLGERGIDVVDIGIPVISMHSTLELSSKADLWWGYLGFRAWLQQ
jgi:aspartyl aminopeptidase